MMDDAFFCEGPSRLRPSHYEHNNETVQPCFIRLSESFFTVWVGEVEPIGRPKQMIPVAAIVEVISWHDQRKSEDTHCLELHCQADVDGRPRERFTFEAQESTFFSALVAYLQPLIEKVVLHTSNKHSIISLARACSLARAA
jgi:hypothetical protein